MYKSISVILPTYKECENLKKLLPQIAQMMTNNKFIYEIIIVDDNSMDGSKLIIENFINVDKIPINFIERKNNRGLASAIIFGTNAAQYDTIVHMDSDLAHSVRDLERMLKLYFKNSSSNTLVIGSRYQPNSIYIGKPWINKLVSYCGRFLINSYLSLDIRDSSNNFRIFSKDGWNKIKMELITDGNIMIVQIAYLLKQIGFVIKEIDIEYIERREGTTKLNIIRETKIFFKQLKKIKQHKLHSI